MDVRVSKLDGIEATRQIVADEASARVHVLTTLGLDEYVVEAVRAGAGGFLLKDGPEEQLLAKIRVVADGGSLFAPAVTRALLEVRDAEDDSRSGPARELGTRSLMGSSERAASLTTTPTPAVHHGHGIWRDLAESVPEQEPDGWAGPTIGRGFSAKNPA
jgi:DNA-binding NarL/FixJ family response regulator